MMEVQEGLLSYAPRTSCSTSGLSVYISPSFILPSSILPWPLPSFPSYEAYYFKLEFLPQGLTQAPGLSEP